MRYRRGGLVSGPMIRDDEVAAVLRVGESQFMLMPNEQIKVGDLVCLDPSTGKIRKATTADASAFRVPPDAWQDGDRLCIPHTSRTIM